MAVIWRNEGGSLRSNPPDIAKSVNQLVKAIQKGAKKGAELSLYAIREQIRNGLSTNSLGLKPISDQTRATRLAGKPEGTFPAKARITGTRPLWASGQTAKAIKIRIKSDTIVMGFDDGDNYMYSKYSIGRAAQNQEKGFTIRGVYTRRMLAYLHIIFKRKKGVGQYSRIPKGIVRVGAEFTRTVDPRPAWSVVIQRMEPTVLNTIEYHIVKEINKTGLTLDIK